MLQNLTDLLQTLEPADKHMVLAIVLLHRTMNPTLINLATKLEELEADELATIFSECVANMTPSNPIEDLLHQCCSNEWETTELD